MFADSRPDRFFSVHTPAKCFLHTNKASRHNRVSIFRRGIVLLLVVSLFLASVGSLAARSNAVLVHGSVVNDQGRPIALATVEMRDLHGIKIASGISDSSGSFSFSSVMAPGEYILLADFASRVAEQPVTVDQGDHELKIILPEMPEHSPVPLKASYSVSAQQLRVPKKARRYLTLAQQELTRLNFEGAEQEADRALQVDSSFAAAFTMRAFLRLASRSPAGAKEDAQHAVSLDPSDADAYLALGNAYNSLGEFTAAEDALRQAIQLRPNLWQGKLELAKAFYGERRFMAALYELEKLSNDFPDVHLVRANILQRFGRSEEAAAEFGKFLKQEPNDMRSEQVRRIVANTDRPAPSSSSLLHR